MIPLGDQLWHSEKPQETHAALSWGEEITSTWLLGGPPVKTRASAF